MNITKIIFLFSLLFGALFLSSCGCDDTLCLNGGNAKKVSGDCVCECPTGFSGQSCETKIERFNCQNGNCVQVSSNGQYTTLSDCQASCSSTSTAGFNCQSGNCVQVSSNGQYTTLSDCQAVCSSTNTAGFNCQSGNCVQVSSNGEYTTLSNCQADCTPTSTAGFNCQSGNCVQVSSNGQYTTLAACQTACTPSTSTLSFKNNTFTNVTITFNGNTNTIAPNNTVSFTGNPGSTGSGSAQTSVTSTTGNQVGLLMSWNLNNTFPGSGNSTIELNVSSEYFFLKLKNNGTSAMSPIYVNYGLTTQTVDYITIPNNGVTYNIGYYKAWSNTSVRGIRGSSYTFWNQGEHFFLPFTTNQSVTLINNFLNNNEEL